MDSDCSSSTFSSSSPVASNNKDESSIELNDVVAVSNGEDGFILGKVVEQRHDSFLLTMYHYKLDTRTYLFKKIELIMNFGSAGGKQIFEVSNDQQKKLLERIRYSDSGSSSLLSLVVDVRKKEEDRLKMLYLITDIFGQLTLNDNGKNLLLLHALQNNVLDCNEFMEIVCTVAAKEEDDTIINRLADILIKVLFEKKSLVFIENKIANDQSPVRFWKQCLWTIDK